MAVGDTFRVTINMRLHGQQCVSVLHYRETNTDFLAHGADVLAARVAAVVVPQFKAIQGSELTHESVVAQKIFPLPPLVPAVVTTAVGPGQVAGGTMPTEVTAVITKRTVFAGRKYRGRIFVPGVPNVSELDSQLSPAALITWQAAANIINSNLTQDNSTWRMIVWHKATSTFDFTTNLEARPILRSQRRRQIGKGR